MNIPFNLCEISEESPGKKDFASLPISREYGAGQSQITQDPLGVWLRNKCWVGISNKLDC